MRPVPGLSPGSRRDLSSAGHYGIGRRAPARRNALRVRAETERRRQHRMRIVLQWADIPAAIRAGYSEAGVWELARRNASFFEDVGDLVDNLNAAGLPARPGVIWDRQAASEVIRLLWPQERASAWPREELGTYPGDLGPLSTVPAAGNSWTATPLPPCGDSGTITTARPGFRPRPPASPPHATLGSRRRGRSPDAVRDAARRRPRDWRRSPRCTRSPPECRR